MENMKKRKFFLFLFLIFGAMSIYIFLAQNNYFNTPELNRVYYKKAMQMEKDGKHRSAYYAFKKVSPRYPAYDAVIFHQAKCASKIEDEKTAIKKFKELIKRYPHSQLQEISHYEIGQAYFRLGNYEEAEQVFKNLAKKFPESEYKIAAYYYVGRINKEKAPEYSIALFKKYLKLAPCGIFAVECVKELESLNAIFSNEDKFNTGVAYYYATKSKDAIKYLKDLPLKKSWYYLAKAYAQDNSRYKSAKTIRYGLVNYSSQLSDSKLFDIIQLYALKTQRTKYDTWTDLVTLTKATSAEDFTLFNKARVSPHNESINIYKKIVNDYPNGNFASEAMWELIWDEYKLGNYKNALYLLKVHRDKYKNKNASGKVLFWTGKILEKQGEKKQALKFYERLLKEYNNDYYAFRAQGRIEAIRNGKDIGWEVDSYQRINLASYVPRRPYTDYKIRIKYSEMFLELLKVEDFDLVSYFDIDDALLESWIAMKKGLASKACYKANMVMNAEFPRPSIRDYRWKLVYPVYYGDEINYRSKHNNINAFIILSLMREESHFNPEAVSSSNAMGLMQLLPRTAKDIANWKNLGKLKNNKDLFIPEVNIKLGSAYLKYTRDTLGKMVYAVAAYNAGPGALQKWIKEKDTSDIDVFVENIPYEQTKNYVKKVYRSYWCYSRLYR